MWKNAPEPIDVQDLQFKLCGKINVFNNTDNTKFSKRCNLVASASRFDLIILGTTGNTLKIVQLKRLQEHLRNDGDIASYPHREIPIPAPARHISTNCEETIVSVIIDRDSTPWALFYDIKSFLQQSPIKLEEIRLSPTPGVDIIDTNWNPTLGGIFTACKSDGSLGVYELKQPGVSINELPPASATTCFRWSPKGKQIAVGSKDGKITQYKPDLKAVKVINAPPLKSVHSLIGLEWISSSQFIGIFQSQNVDDPVNLVVIDTPKTGTPSFINYDDICYSNGNTRPTQFYTILQRNWNILMVASSNSMEVGVLSSSNDIWTQWIMGDASRAELPLNDNREESLPIGFALNTSNQQEIPWGESNLPPTPILLLLSHFGTLCCFNVINLKEGLPNICSPPDPIVQTINPNLFTIKSVAKAENVPQQQQQIPKAVTFGNLTNQVKAQEIPKVSQSSPFIVNQSTPIANKISTVSTPVVAVTAVTTTPTPKNQSKIETPQLNETLQKVESQAEIDAETEKLFAQMVREECVFLESEIKNLLSRCKSLKINVGSDSDKTTIVQLTSIIDEFLKEMVDITTGQNAEVHSLKQNLLQSFAWYEEAKSRFNATQDEKLSILQRAQPLDSASKKQLADLRHSSYYLESQLTQAHRALDEQWENFQDYCRKTYKIKMPTMEAIFQTMVNQMAIIQKQSYVLKDIACRIKQRSRQPIGPTLLINVEDPKELENELKRLTLEPESIQQIQIEFVKNRLKYFTKTKTDNLRNFLQNRKIPNITPIKPQITNTSIRQSSASKLKQLSLLGAKLSPVSKDIVKKLDFTQSTPKAVPETTPIENLEKFTQKFEQNSLKLLDKTVTPSFTIKTTLPSGPNSAFVPTSLSIAPIAITTVVLTNAPTSKPVISVSNVKTTSSFGVSSAEVSKPFTFNFVNKTTPTTATPITTPKTSLFTFTTQPTTVNTTAAANTFTFNFGDKNVAATNTVFKPTTTTASVFGFQNNKPTVFGEKPLFTSLAPATIPATTSTIKSTASLFGSATVATAKPTTDTVSIVKATPSTTTATTLFGNVSFAPKTTVATIGQSTIFVAPKTTATIQPSTKPSLTITPVTPTTSQQTPTATTTTPTAPATLIFTSKPSITTTTVVATTTIATPAIVSVASVKAISTAASSSTPSLASVAPTIKPILTVPSVVATNTSTTQPLNLVTSTKSSSFTPVTTQTSIFASVAPVTTTQSIFGSVDKSKSLFGTTATTTSSIFGNTNTSTASKSIFGSAPVFGSSAPSFPPTSILGASTPTTTTQSVFGASPTTTASTGSIFGGTTPITTTSIFGGTAPTTSATSIFGAAIPTTSTTTTTTTTASVFGGFGQPTATTKSVFGTTPATTGSIFGGAVSTSVAPSVFGNTPSTFGGAATPTTQFGSTTFGAVPATTAPFSQQSSVFGQSRVFGANTSFGSTPSSFGAVAPASTTNSFSFGQSSGSIFGNATTTSSGSIFGNTTTTSSGFGGSVFGGSGSVSNTTPFGATAPASGVFATTQPSSFSFTAAAATNSGASSGFGFGCLNVGSTPTTSAFGGGGGGGTTSANPFGATSSTEQKSIFGSTPASSSGSIFGGGGGASSGGSSIFGGGTTTQSFGSQPTFGGQSTFGQQSAFGQSTFGTRNTSTGSFFGSSGTTGPFSGAATGGGSVGQTGFGAQTNNSSFQTTSGFGSPPAFGATATGTGPQSPTTGSAFGAAPSFGGAPTFGSSATFGSSPSRVFGSGGSTFGNASTAQSPSFGNLANQPTVGFGNLAQQATTNQTNSAPFSGNSSFSSWR